MSDDVEVTPEQEERQLHRVIAEEEKQVELPAEVRVHEDETKENRTPGFSRMRTSWGSPEAAHMASLRETVDSVVFRAFPDATRIMFDLYSVVRFPKLDDNGDEMVDGFGWPIWEKTSSGAYKEDYSRLGVKEREQFLFQITTNLYEWRQRSSDLWGETMFAKGRLGGAVLAWLHPHARHPTDGRRQDQPRQVVSGGREVLRHLPDVGLPSCRCAHQLDGVDRTATQGHLGQLAVGTQRTNHIMWLVLCRVSLALWCV